MVQRASQESQFKTGQEVQATQSGIGFAAPDADKFATTNTFDGIGQEDGSNARLLERILGTVSGLAKQSVQQSQEEAYLSGVAKAGTIQSEAELDASPLMRDWQTAGYRDTMGRVAAADNEATIAADMAKMREASPEEFASYLKEKRANVMASWEGMTADTRKTMFAQQLMNERAAIKKHAVEHYKFGVETEQKSIKAALGSSLATLSAAKDDAGAYAMATDATFATAYSSIFANPKLPTEAKGKLLAEFATFALEGDHQALFEQITTRMSKHPDGTEGRLSDMMSWEDSTGLSKAYQASRKRTEAFRAADYMDRTAAYKADWDNPSAALMPLAAVRSHLAEGIQRGLVSADQYQSIMNDYYEKSAKKVASSDLAQAYAAGDQGKLLSLGKTSQEGLAAYVETMGRKMQLPQVVDSLFSIGATTGQANAYRKVGELLAPAFAQIGNSDKIDPANAASIATTLQRLAKAEQDGQTGAFHQFLGAFDPEVQAKVTYMRDNLRKGNEPTAAIAAATARVLEDQKMTPAMRAEVAATNSKEILAAVGELEPRSIWSTITTGVSSLWNSDDAAKMKLTTRREWYENEERVNEVMAGARVALGAKMTEISTANPSMPIKSVRSMALADVASRTVETDWGPLVVPSGTSPQKFFRVGSDVGTERISAALKEFIKPAEGNRVAFKLGVSGQLMYQELNAEGRPASKARILDPAQVAPMVQAQRQRMADKFRTDHGEGVTTKVGNVSVTYNGDNTQNVDNGWMRAVRSDLVGHEGVRDSVYKDADGNATAGVGILVQKAGSAVNTGAIRVGPDGKVAQADINESFLRESDRAAGTAVRVMANTGLRGESAFKLYTALAYQSGNGFSKLPAYQPVFKAIAAKDLNAAITALKASPAYRKSQPERQQYYLNNLQAAMKG